MSTETQVNCVCPASGLCSRRNANIPDLHWRKCQSGQVSAIDRLYLDPPMQQKQPVISSVKRAIRTGYGDALAAVITRETGHHADCSGCQNEIAALNTMSRQSILAQQNQLAYRIRARGQLHSRAWWQRWGCKIAPAIVESKIKSWIAEAVGGEPEPIKQSGALPVGVRHLTYHVYPTKHHDGWMWNLRQIAKRSDMFSDGKRVLGISTDTRTHDQFRVIDFCHEIGLSWTDLVVKPNSRALREVQTWLPMLEVINPPACSESEVVFSAHAKGVRHDSMQRHISAWADVMYRTCLDDIQLVDVELSKYLATGSFKRYGNFKTPGNYQWHYSGTFYWWRPLLISERKWKKIDRKFFGTESWLGHQAKPDETGCLFIDHCEDLYQMKYWEDVVWPAWSESSWGEAEKAELIKAAST